MVLVEKAEGNSPHGRHNRPGWEDNIKMYVKEIEWKGVDRIGVAQDREKPGAVVSTVMNFGLHKVQITF
jgi:hypothetical protein